MTGQPGTLKGAAGAAPRTQGSGHGTGPTEAPASISPLSLGPPAPSTCAVRRRSVQDQSQSERLDMGDQTIAAPLP